MDCKQNMKLNHIFHIENVRCRMKLEHAFITTLATQDMFIVCTVCGTYGSFSPIHVQPLAFIQFIRERLEGKVLFEHRRDAEYSNRYIDMKTCNDICTYIK